MCRGIRQRITLEKRIAAIPGLGLDVYTGDVKAGEHVSVGCAPGTAEKV
jgi:hypothetical protein